MTVRIPLPDDQWADLRTPGELHGGHQDAYFDKYDEMMAEKPQPAPQPDPANPAVMLEPAQPRFTRKDGRVLRDWLMGQHIVGWSYDVPLPYCTEVKPQIPVLALNILYEKIQVIDDALTGAKADEDPDVPKSGPPTGITGSSDTSEAGTGSPLPAPQEVPSSTPQGLSRATTIRGGLMMCRSRWRGCWSTSG